eukprot:2356614-Rhodomonas_salina.5
MSIQNVPRPVPMFLRSTTANARNSYRTRDIQCIVYKDDKHEVLSRKPAQSKSDCSMESTQPAVAEHLSNSFWRGQSTELQVEKTQKYSSVEQNTYKLGLRNKIQILQSFDNSVLEYYSALALVVKLIPDKQFG